MQRWVSAACACAWISSFSAPASFAQEAISASVASSSSGVTEVVPLPGSNDAEPPASDTLALAKTLLADGKAAEAYALLSLHELTLAGSPDFDYLLGIAALESHRPKDAAFALERVVASEPGFLGARLDLARAQVEGGEYKLARDQFRFLMTQQPPPETRALIARYLDSIGNRETHFGSRWSAQGQFGAGYDSNANGSTSEQTFLGFTLNPRNVETGSSFGELTLDGGHVLSVSPTFGVISNGQLTHRSNTDASFIDQSVATLGSTAVWLHESYRFTGGVDGYAGWLASEDHERGVNLNLGASRQFGDYEGAVSLRAGRLGYQEEALRILDANRYLAGASLTRANVGPRAARIGVALLVGTDDAKQADSPYGNDRYGVRLFGSMTLRPKATMYAELSQMSTNYDGSFFGGTRDDHQFGATVAFDLQNFPAKSWSLTPRLRFVKNVSSVALYEYDRFEAVVFIRRGF